MYEDNVLDDDIKDLKLNKEKEMILKDNSFPFL